MIIMDHVRINKSTVTGSISVNNIIIITITIIFIIIIIITMM